MNPNFDLSMPPSAHIELAWQMGSASLAANNNQILINSSVYKLIGPAGIDQLKLRLRYVSSSPSARIHLMPSAPNLVVLLSLHTSIKFKTLFV